MGQLTFMRILAGFFAVLFFAQAAAVMAAAQAGDTALDALLAERAEAFGIVGQSVVVLKDGKPLMASTHGEASRELAVPVQQDTVFQVFSVAKLFVNTVMMQLAESGDVSLAAPISTYLPGAPAHWQHITVRQLMAHTSGLPDYYRWPAQTPETEAAATALAASDEQVFETGTAYRYNQTNYLLLKQIIETVTGQPFQSVMQARMITPLGLENTRYGGEYAVVPGRARTYFAGEHGLLLNGPIFQPDYMFASTGLNSSAPDMARWMAALLAGQFLPADRLAHYWQPYPLTGGGVSRFAAGWEFAETEKYQVVGHGGGNRVDVRHFTDKSSGRTVTVIYMTNGASRNFWPGTVSTAIADLVMPGVRTWLD